MSLLGQYLTEPPLAVITAVRLLGFVRINYAHLDPDIFAKASFTSCQRLSNSSSWILTTPMYFWLNA